MRKSRSNRKILMLVALGFVLSTAFFNCQQFSSDSKSSSAGLFGSEEPAIPVGFLSSEQMLKAMISVTGVEGLGELTDPADDLIDRTYAERTGSLPSANDIFQATGPTLISATNLASTVCAKAVDRDRATPEDQRDSRIFFREFNFTQGLSGQSSDSVTSSFTRLARNAWRREPKEGELSNIVSFAQEFSSGASPTDIAQTRLLAISVCTVAISSLDALTY